MKQWNDLLTQLNMLKAHEGASLSSSALNMIEVMQKQLESQKKKLEGRSEALENQESSSQILINPPIVEEFSSVISVKSIKEEPSPEVSQGELSNLYKCVKLQQLFRLAADSSRDEPACPGDTTAATARKYPSATTEPGN